MSMNAWKSILLVVAARSGSGKTTMLAGLIPALAKRGVSAAVIKLTHAAFPAAPTG